MSRPDETAKQLDDETIPDYVKFLVFLRLGLSRDLNHAYSKYYEYGTANAASQSWHMLANKYHWIERAAEHDHAVQKTHK